MDNITALQIKAVRELDVDKDGMVEFGEVARNVLHQQCQYASYYVSGLHGTPILTADLRIDGNAGDYHSLRIHQDDVITFVRRVNDYRTERGLNL